METFAYAHLPVQVHIALFTDISNAPQLRNRIVEASTMLGDDGDAERAAVNFAFVNARLVTSLLHIQTAVYQAILTDLQGSLRTKTVHSEILWALNPSNNITEAIRRFGVSDTSMTLLVVRVATPNVDRVDIEQQMKTVVQGTLVALTVLEAITDWQSVKKYYKLNDEPAVKAAGKESIERERAVVNEIVVSSVAMKSVMA